ncbi:MAG TPA: ABC transporter ATP-binding protein [Mycobacterium sp.]|nr:ABC transporter ATP-binding protein [Mycobacterium sp.]HUH67885.1 ABC transporter ATP-binding protein [Mycobacterium sp.]
MNAILELVDVDVRVGDTEICRDVSLTIADGETHVLFGTNGSGKSSLLAAVMGLPPYEIARGEVRLLGTPIGKLPVDERARLGLGLAFQRPPALQGVSLRDLAGSLGALRDLENQATPLDFGEFLDRDINVGFSGGEIKRWEILKLCLQHPALCLFDEPESGVDLEHIAAVGAAIDRLLQRVDGSRRSALVITHTGFILDYLKADVGHLMVDGRLVHSGDPYQLFEYIKQRGYTVAALTETEVGPLVEIGYGAEQQHAGTCVIVDNEVRRSWLWLD